MKSHDMKIGMKVRIITWRERPRHWNSSGRMDSWQGKAVTLKQMFTNQVKIKEDDKRPPTPGASVRRGGWLWRKTDFETLDGLSDWNIKNEWEKF